MPEEFLLFCKIFNPAFSAFLRTAFKSSRSDATFSISSNFLCLAYLKAGQEGRVSSRHPNSWQLQRNRAETQLVTSLLLKIHSSKRMSFILCPTNIYLPIISSFSRFSKLHVSQSRSFITWTLKTASGVSTSALLLSQWGNWTIIAILQRTLEHII